MKKNILIVVGVIAMLLVVLFTISSLKVFDTIGTIRNTNYSLDKKGMVLINRLGKDTTVSFSGERPKLIHFWATFCKPCIAEFDSIVKYRSNLNNADLFIISLESHEKVEEFLKDRKLDLPFYTMDSLKLPFEPKTIKFFPTTIVIKSDSVVSTGVGVLDWKDVNLN